MQNKKKMSLIIFVSILILILTITFVSSERLPIVGGDTNNWGTILNQFLNVSLNESGEIRPANITFAQKVTFAFGEVIDNIIDGWITITGGLNVTQNLNVIGNAIVEGDLNVTGNVSLNGISIDDLGFGSILGYTSSSYDGNISNGSLNGYSAATAICNAEYDGSHFCLKSEVLKTIANGDYSFSGTGWFANGPPGYTANADDCSGWTTNSNIYLGPFWNWDANSQAGRGALTNCAQTKQLMCCRGSS